MNDQTNTTEYKKRVARIVRYSVIFLSIFILGGLTPYQDIFFGLALGTAVSILNLIITANKVNKIGEVAANKNLHTTPRPIFTGMLSRFALAILAIMFALEYPQYFNFSSTLVGLFVAQVIAVIDGIKHRF